MNYFENISTKEELKKRFRKLCRELHPDAGGDHHAFIEMKTQYDNFLALNNFQAHERKSKSNFWGWKNEVDNKDLIDRLLIIRMQRQRKPGWVYFAFVDECEDPTMEDFEYLAEKLGYKPGWAYFKHKEYYE